MCEVYCFKLPVVFIKMLPDFSSGILIAAAVNKADLGFAKLYKPDFGRALYVVAVF